jgi:hypothetical protein
VTLATLLLPRRDAQESVTRCAGREAALCANPAALSDINSVAGTAFRRRRRRLLKVRLLYGDPVLRGAVGGTGTERAIAWLVAAASKAGTKREVHRVVE